MIGEADSGAVRIAIDRLIRAAFGRAEDHLLNLGAGPVFKRNCVTAIVE